MKKKSKKLRRFRIEKDVMGKVKVPIGAYYGIFSVRAMKNFPISNLTIHPELNKAIVQIKKAAAQTNMECGILDKKIGRVIIRACDEILKGKYEDQFILDIYQAGAGTPWHMNVNEVVANVALEVLGKKKGGYDIVDPHDHVNMSQSTNDVMPSATRIACLILADKLIFDVKKLASGLNNKAREFRGLAKVGRTHYRDAVPITLGQEFGAWAFDIGKRVKVINNSLSNLKNLSIGGTAVGTGFNAPRGFDGKVVRNLRKNTGLSLYVAKNKIEETQFMSDFLDLSASLRSLVVDLIKICNDIIFLSSGPMAGIREIDLPEVEPGSSIMPGKFNPSIVEMLKMVCEQIIGNDEVIKQAAESGNLELNIMVPIISHNLLHGMDILTNGIREFNNNCIKGIKANKKVLQQYFEKNPAIGAVLNKIIGYDKAAEVVREAIKEKKSIKEIVLKKGILSKKEADRIFRRKNFGLE